MSNAEEWGKENQERKEYLSNKYTSDDWYERLVADKQLETKTTEYFKLPY